MKMESTPTPNSLRKAGPDSSPASSSWPTRLGKNRHGYLGETIDVEMVLHQIQSRCLETGWRQECFHLAGTLSLCGYHRLGVRPRKRVYISTGIHGDEPAGPLAVLQLVQENRWPDNLDLWLCPCLNPTGFPLNRRENAAGIDLNRDYLHLTTDEIRAHVGWLQNQPNFDFTVILHEDWEANGYYLYELNPDRHPSLAEKIIRQVSLVCPIETAPQVDGWPAEHGIIRPDIHPRDRPQWPEAIYLIRHKTPQSLTLEAPSDFPLSTRVAAHVTAVRAVLDELNS
jgi:murein peptide amidase A